MRYHMTSAALSNHKYKVHVLRLAEYPNSMFLGQVFYNESLGLLIVVTMSLLIFGYETSFVGPQINNLLMLKINTET